MAYWHTSGKFQNQYSYLHNYFRSQNQSYEFVLLQIVSDSYSSLFNNGTSFSDFWETNHDVYPQLPSNYLYFLQSNVPKLDIGPVETFIEWDLFVDKCVMFLYQLNSVQLEDDPTWEFNYEDAYSGYFDDYTD